MSCRFLINQFAFFPDRSDVIPTDQLPPGVEEVFVDTQDGEKLQCYWLDRPKSKQVLIYFHGNAGNIGHRLPDLMTLAEMGISAPDESAINLVYQTLSQQLDSVELLTRYEGNAFASTGNLVEDLLSITSVHPMREDAVQELLSRGGADWKLVQGLLDERQLVQTEYQGRKFYVRRLEQKPGER